MMELIEQHFGFLGLYEWFATKTHFGHEEGADKSSRADTRCTRLRIALLVFFVSTGTLGLRRFGGRTKSWVSTHQKRNVPGQVGMMGNFCKQQFSF